MDSNLISYVEGAQLEDGDEIVEIIPQYDAELYESLKLPIPAAEKFIKKAVKQDPPPANDPPVDDDDNDDILLAKLKKRGLVDKDATTLESFKPKPAPVNETEAEKTARLNKEKITFALQNNLLTPDRLAEYNQDMVKDSRQIVYESFLEKHKDSGKSPEQIENMFQKMWMLDNDDPDDADLVEEKRAEMEEAAEKIRKKKHSDFYSLDDKYQEHLSASEQTQKLQEKTLKVAKAYRSDFDEIVTRLSKEEYVIGEGDMQQVIPFTYDEKVLEEAKTEFLNVKYLEKFVGNYQKSELEMKIRNFLKDKTENARIGFAARKYHSMMMEKKKIGRKNLNPDESGSSGDVIERDEEMYRLLDAHLPKAN